MIERLLRDRQGVGLQRSWIGWKLALAWLGALAFCAPAATATSHEKKDIGDLRVNGYVTKVESSRITIMSMMGDGKLLPLATQEDFTLKVAKGSKVTAWYVVQGDGYVLKWLDYPLENAFTSAKSIRGRVRRAIILPSSGVAEADGLYDAITQFLETNLKWRFAPRALAEGIRRSNASTAATTEAASPSGTGTRPAPAASEPPNLMALIARETKVNAVLEVEVEQVEAPVSHSTAMWDGVEEPAGASKGLLTSARSLVAPAKDTVPAATVVFRLWDSRGKLMWSNRRGFALLAVREGKELQERPLTDVLRNGDNVDRWLELVFHSLLPGPRAASTGRS